MRTSEAERQRVAEFLRDACADGRLTAEELEQRLDRLFAGGTVGDIERLVWDLPGGQAVIPRLSGAPRTAAPVRRRPASPMRPAAVAVACFGLAALIFFSLPPFLAVVSLAILLATAVALAAIAAALAPAGLLLFGIGWLISRLWRGRFGPPARGWNGGRRGHPFG